MSARTGLYSKRFLPSAAQVKYLCEVNAGVSDAHLRAAVRTILACRMAGWIVAVHPNKPYQISPLGRDALRQMQEERAA